MKTFDKIEMLTAVLKGLLPLKPEYQQKLDKKFRLEFNYNSNHIEGNTLTYSETELLLIFDDTKGSHTLREYEEMKAHDVAYQMIKEWAKDKERPLTEQNIKNLNEVILVRPYWKEAITPDGQATRRQIKVGDYKEFPNSVRLQNGQIFEYASPIDTPIEMQGLMDWYRDEEPGLHPVTLAAMLHYKFVRIHPFDDGNGRIARLLMNYVLLRNNLPPVVIKSNEKQEYIGALHLADVGDFEPFINYIAEQVVWSLELNIKAARGKDIEEKEDFDKEISLLNKMMEGVGDEITKTKNEKVMQEVLGKVVEPLFRKVFEKILKLSPMFASTEFTYFIDGGGSSHHNINDLMEDIKLGWHQKKGDVKKISLNITLNKLKKLGTKAFNVGDAIQINFEEHLYQIELQQKETIDNLYHHMLIETEIDEIATRFVRNIFNHIEQQVKSRLK